MPYEFVTRFRYIDEDTLINASFSSYYASAYAHNESSHTCAQPTCNGSGVPIDPPGNESCFTITPRLSDSDMAALQLFIDNSRDAESQSLRDLLIIASDCPWLVTNEWQDDRDVGHWRSLLIPYSYTDPYHAISHPISYGWYRWLQQIVHHITDLGYDVHGCLEWRDEDDVNRFGLVYMRNNEARFASPQISWNETDKPSSY